MKHFLIACIIALATFSGATYVYAQDAGPAAAVEAVAEEAAAPAAEAVPDVAPADEIESAQEALGVAGDAVSAFKEKKWAVFAGLVLMLLVWVGRKFVLKRLDGVAVLWTTLGLGVAAAVAMNLVAEMAWLDAVLMGVTASLSSVGWDQFFKKLKVQEA